jgi:hypothetical protein
LLEQLQKLCLAVTESRHEQEKDYDQLRYITNKVQQMLSTQGVNRLFLGSLYLETIHVDKQETNADTQYSPKSH